MPEDCLNIMFQKNMIKTKFTLLKLFENDSALQHCNSLPISLCSVCSQRPTATLGLSYILAKDFRIHFLVEMQGIKSRNFKRCILSAAIILLANRLSTDFTCNYSPMDQLRREFTSFLFTSRTVGPFMFDLNTNTNPN
jgi:hypothetical protein